MTGRQWKPGDVALIQPPSGPERVAILVGGTDGPCWHSAYDDGDLMCLAAEAIPPARPLVVIDPEDREQVERFRRACHGDSPGGYCRCCDGSVEGTQDALRSLIAPEPEPEPGSLAEVLGQILDRLDRLEGKKS